MIDFGFGFRVHLLRPLLMPFKYLLSIPLASSSPFLSFIFDFLIDFNEGLIYVINLLHVSRVEEMSIEQWEQEYRARAKREIWKKLEVGDSDADYEA